MVSNCDSNSGREIYAAELGKHIDVTIFGDCGKEKCQAGPTCDRTLTSFRFYLAFENSVCVDYATEKMHLALTRNLIPIVYGMYDYRHNLPERSFIDVRDFDSPKHLANYLHKLARNKTLYDSYFRWKQHYEVINYSFKTRMAKAACAVCHYLHITKHDAPKTVNLSTMNRYRYCIPKEKFLRSVGVNITQGVNLTEFEKYRSRNPFKPLSSYS